MKFEAQHGGRVVPIEIAGAAGRYTIALEGNLPDGITVEEWVTASR